MATVYLARDLKHQRAVAIKVLDPELGHAIAPSGSCARSRSRRACSTHTFSRSMTRDPPAVFLYYVMPYVEGEDAIGPPLPRKTIVRRRDHPHHLRGGECAGLCA